MGRRAYRQRRGKKLVAILGAARRGSFDVISVARQTLEVYSAITHRKKSEEHNIERIPTGSKRCTLLSSSLTLSREAPSILCSGCDENSLFSSLPECQSPMKLEYAVRSRSGSGIVKCLVERRAATDQGEGGL